MFLSYVFVPLALRPQYQGVYRHPGSRFQEIENCFAWFTPQISVAQPSPSQDRTLKMQHKAPIRSQTLGPAMPGKYQNRTTGQHKGIRANPSTGQSDPVFESILE